MEKIFPFDLVPRIVSASEWSRIERGLKQRITALNLFIDDLYHDQKILKDGVLPADIVLSSKAYRKACVGFNPPRGIWCHITGTDLVRDGNGQILVLEDNLRCPSGVSYVLQNRLVIKRTFPQLFESSRIRPVDDYPSRLRDMLESLSPQDVETPRVVVLTPVRQAAVRRSDCRGHRRSIRGRRSADRAGRTRGRDPRGHRPGRRRVARVRRSRVRVARAVARASGRPGRCA